MLPNSEPKKMCKATTPWRAKLCGGADIFGSKNCTQFKCECIKTINHNYSLWYELAAV